MTNFDTIIDRRGTACLKYDFAKERGHAEDALPLWVADMDFSAPAQVLSELSRRVQHGVFGYTDVKEDYADACVQWFRNSFDWAPDPSWLTVTPGVVFALAMSVRAFSDPGDGVMLMSPVYYPFYDVIRDNHRRIVDCPLLETDGHYEIDFALMERLLRFEQPKVFLLCSPHNPVGRVWTEEELSQLGELCRKYHVTVISDEIHCDFALPGHPHTPFLKADPASENNSIICTSASKTFNLAGLQCSNIWISSQTLREKFRHEIAACGYSQPNLMGLVATKSAYETGYEWHQENWAYMQENLLLFREYLAFRLPMLRLIEPEGTYFAWVDCSGLQLSDLELTEFISSDANLWLDGGGIFGGRYGQYQRFTLSSPRQIILQALDQLYAAVQKRFGGASIQGSEELLVPAV
ncbi:MAG: pyridoxal phosphate-dependent aminotransferase [Clostridia bacterium]|nr:pyridoxal phosphate-dependent aminotransferase [Clostridia bacterium]